MEIPKAMIVEKIQGRDGAEKAAADKELPDKVDTDADAGLLKKYDIDPKELTEDFESDALADFQQPHQKFEALYLQTRFVVRQLGLSLRRREVRVLWSIQNAVQIQGRGSLVFGFQEYVGILDLRPPLVVREGFGGRDELSMSRPQSRIGGVDPGRKLSDVQRVIADVKPPSYTPHSESAIQESTLRRFPHGPASKITE